MDVIKRKYKLNITGNTYISIPLTMDLKHVRQDDDMENNLIRDEVNIVTNPIVDYERLRYKCVYIDDDNNSHNVSDIIYELIFINGGTWYDIGFNKDDIKYNKQSLFMSFLEIKLYTEKDVNNRKLIDYIKMYPNKQYLSSTSNFPNIPIQLKVSSNINDKASNNDGYFLYYKEDLFDGDNRLFAEINFFNAKSGKLVRLLTGDGFSNVNNKIKVNEIMDNRFIEYKFINSDERFDYNIRGCINNLSTINNEKQLTVSLFELKVE